METDFKVGWTLSKTGGLTLQPRDDESAVEFARWLLRTHDLMTQMEKKKKSARIKKEARE